MKAIYKEILKENAASQFVVENLPVPEVDKNSVLIQVKACGLSDVNDKVQRILYKKNPIPGYGIGADVAGVVKQVGSEVSTLVKGDEVVGIIPLDYNLSGCAEYVVLDEFDVVKKPPGVSFVDAAGCIGDAVKAYTALHYQGRMNSGDTVLILDGASSFGSLAVQLAQHWGAKVISTASSEDEKLYLDGIDPELALVIEMTKERSIVNLCMEETGGVGVDIVVDNGVSQFSKEEDSNIVSEAYKFPVPTKHEIISTLSVGGRWVTTMSNLQLDPPNSRLLFLKCASVGFLFEQAWTLSSAQQGRYQHILMDIMEKVASGALRPNIHHTVPFESTPDTLKQLSSFRVGKVVMTA